MSPVEILTIILVLGTGTYLMRLSFIYLFGRVQPPGGLAKALRFVPVAALTALTVPALLFPGGAIDVSPANPRLYAGLLAFVVAYRTKSVLWTLAVGMLSLWILTWLLA